jgi:hypothetical protein
MGMTIQEQVDWLANAAGTPASNHRPVYEHMVNYNDEYGGGHQSHIKQEMGEHREHEGCSTRP